MSDVGDVAAGLRTHLQWLEKFGVTGVPRGGRRERPGSGTGTGTGTGTGAGAGARGESLGLVRLEAVRTELGDCTRCKLSGGRKTIVFGVGNPDAKLVFVGEAPGFHEDEQGEPFVGDAGALLTKMIIAMGRKREDVYICNIIKCRPPGNRNPEPDELAACEPFLRQQLGAIRPRAIVALGKFAAQALLRTDASISTLRGHFHEYQGIPLMPTYHPAYLLRTPTAKRMVWDDLQLVMKHLADLGV